MGKLERYAGRKIRHEVKKNVHHNWEDFWRSMFQLGLSARIKLAYRIIRKK